MVMPYGQLFALVKSGTATFAISQRFSVSQKFTTYRVDRAGLRGMYRKRTKATATR